MVIFNNQYLIDLVYLKIILLATNNVQIEFLIIDEKLINTNTWAQSNAVSGN